MFLRLDKFLSSFKKFLYYNILINHKKIGGGSSVGRTSAFQAEGRGFESRPPLSSS